jgi:hypothetical protein
MLHLECVAMVTESFSIPFLLLHFLLVFAIITAITPHPVTFGLLRRVLCPSPRYNPRRQQKLYLKFQVSLFYLMRNWLRLQFLPCVVTASCFIFIYWHNEGEISVTQPVMKFSHFVELKCSLPFSQNPLTEPHFEPVECDPDPIFYVFFSSLMRTTCPVHLALFYLIAVINYLFSEKYSL